MKLAGRRESSNVDDRRRSGGNTSLSGIGKMGIGGIVVIALITWALGGNPLDVLQSTDTTTLGQVTEQSSTGHRRQLPTGESMWLLTA